MGLLLRCARTAPLSVQTMPLATITIIHNAMIMVISDIILIYGTVMPEMSCVCKS